MILDATTRKLQAWLGGAATTTNPTVTVVFKDVPKRTKDDFSEYWEALQFTTLDGTTEKDVLDAPDEDICRKVVYLAVYNADTVNAVVTIAVDDNGTNRIQNAVTLQSTESLTFTPDNGWSIQT